MHHITTTPQAVSKLRKQAKLRVKGDSSLILANALELVAKEAGYLHWQHVTVCLANTARSAASGHIQNVTVRQVFPGDICQKRDEQDFIVVRGEPGVGKSLKAAQYALEWLKEGRPVHILDVGGSYRHMCKLLGGRYVSVERDGSRLEEEQGNLPLVVVDFEMALRSDASLQTTHGGSTLLDIRSDALLLVDELWNVELALSGQGIVLQEVVQSHLSAGGSAVVLCQSSASDDDRRELFSKGVRTRSTVRRTLIDLQRMR